VVVVVAVAVDVAALKGGKEAENEE